MKRVRRGAGQATRVAVAGFLVVTGVVVGTALLVPLLRELPAPVRHYDPALVRGGALAVVWVGLFTAVRWWAGLRRPAGALVHLRVADESVYSDESMRDRHVGVLRQARRRGVPARSVSRSVSLAPRAGRGPVDLAPVCTDVAAAVEAMLNHRWDDARLVLAADMPWPAALAVGAQLPVTADVRLLELTGWPDGTGPGAPEAVFALPTKPARSLDTLTVERWTVPDAPPRGRVGLIIALSASLDHLDPAQIFARHEVSEYHVVQSPWTAPGVAAGGTHDFTGRQLTALARRLPVVLADLRRRCGSRELVIAAALPGTLALAVGWGLARTGQPFFAGTHFLHHDRRRNGYHVLRTHPAQLEWQSTSASRV